MLADAEPLLELPPMPFPATIEVERIVGDNATVAYRGNRYSVRRALAAWSCSFANASGARRSMLSPRRRDPRHHRLARRLGGTRAQRRTPSALEHAVLSAFTTDRPCDRKANRHLAMRHSPKRPSSSVRAATSQSST